MPMLMPMPPPQMGQGGMGMGAPPSGMQPPQSPTQQPSFGGQASMQSQPSGGDQSADPRTILTAVFSKFLDLVDAVNTQFPGGEDKISQGMQLVGTGFQEKIMRIGSPEPPGPPTPA